MSHRPRAAFTLFEVMISLLVLTTAILATVALLPIGLKAQQLARSQMFAATTAMTLINNFHTPVDKFEGISRLSPRYDGIPGTDTTSTAQAPFTGWAGAIEEQSIHASPYQPNFEQQMGWLTGVLPVPTEIARRLDSDNDEIRRLVNRGGLLLYPDPNFMMGLNQGAAQDKTLQILPTSELQKLVFAVTSLPQQNALSSNPAVSLPRYEVYPFPPEWVSMQAFGRETRRLVGTGGEEGGVGSQGFDLWYPNPWWNIEGPTPIGMGTAPQWPYWYEFGGARAAWWYGNDNNLPSSTMKRTGLTLAGNWSNNWYISLATLDSDDGGHGRYEPVRFGPIFRQGQEQDTYFPNNPIDNPDWDGDYLDNQVVATGNSQYHGNGFSHGRNWRFFAAKMPNSLWNDGSQVVSATPNYAWTCFQALAGVDDNALQNAGTNSRATYVPTTEVDPMTTMKFQDPMAPQPSGVNYYHRSGWLPIRAMITNPDGPAFEHLQNMDWGELMNGDGWFPGALNPTQTDAATWRGTTAIDYVAWGNVKNLTWRSAAPRGVTLPASYEMRANYRDRAIDLWQAVMPKFSIPAANILQKNGNALVKNSDGGTMVDCNKYEYPPSELDNFKFIRPDQLDPRDLPIHPAQVLALSYLAHSAMMVTGYAAPFGQALQHDNAGNGWFPMDVMKCTWEGLNWTYRKTAGESNTEVSLWSTRRALFTDPPGWPVQDPMYPSPVYNPLTAANVMNKDAWEYPRFWEFIGPGNTIPGWERDPKDPSNNGIELVWKTAAVQQWPISQPVPGQGITKDALVLAIDPTTALDGNGHPTDPTKTGEPKPGDDVVYLRNDTNHGWVVYPGDEIVFQAHYYQWWYKWSKPFFGWGGIWGAADSYPQWDGRYDPDRQWYPTYPNMQYRLQTFRVLDVQDASGNSLGAKPNEVTGSTTAVLRIKIWPPLPEMPLQYNDARVSPRRGPPPMLATGGGEMDPVALHQGTLVRRVANPSDIAFARKAYEMAMQWAAAYAAESPYDVGAPRPANHQIMMDKPLAQYDLFYDAGNATSDGNAVRVPSNPPTSSGTPGALSSRRNESFYRWLVPPNQVPDSWFRNGAAPSGLHGLSNFGPGRDRQSYFEQMAYNNQLNPPSPTSDDKRFWLTKPFAAFHRARQLTFWSVDWKSYADAETVPSAPMDFAKHNRYLRRDPAANDYDFIAPWVDYGHSPLCGNPESLYVWVSPDRQQRYVDVVGGDSAGWLYQNWIGAPDQQRSGTHVSISPGDPDWTTATSSYYPSTADPPATNGQPVSADVHLGHWGADRNGNGVLDIGPVPAGAHMRAVHVADFVFYDPVLRVHYGN